MWRRIDEELRGGRAACLTLGGRVAYVALAALLAPSACGDGPSSRPAAPAPAATTPDVADEPGVEIDGSADTDGAEATGPVPADSDEPVPVDSMAEGVNPSPDVPAPGTNIDPLEMLLSQYRDWQPLTAQPVNVSAEIFVLCRSPTLAENAFVETEHGQSRMLMDWLNPAARDGFDALGARDFAVGSAIVKEKLAYREGVAEPVLVAIGIMLKHEPGFDSEHGDWEFGYWEEEPGLIDGPDQSAYCADCHASSPTDFVFLDDSWRNSSDTE
jgi:hypothetical protein